MALSFVYILIFILYSIVEFKFECTAQAVETELLAATDLNADNSLQQCSQLFHPLTLGSFIKDFFEQKPLLLRRQKDFYGSLLSLQEIDALLTRNFLLKNIIEESNEEQRLHSHGTHWKLVRSLLRNDTWRSGSLRNESLTLSEVHRAFRHKFSLIVNRMQTKSSNVRSLVNILSSCLGFRVSANLYLTPAYAQGFEAHMDWMVVLKSLPFHFLYSKCLTA